MAYHLDVYSFFIANVPINLILVKCKRCNDIMRGAEGGYE